MAYIKKLMLIAGAVIIARLTSCNKNDNDTFVAGEPYVITAQAKAGATGGDIVWKKGDKIELFYAANSTTSTFIGVFTLRDEDDGKTQGSFVGRVPPMYSLGQGEYYATYGWMAPGMSAFTTPKSSGTTVEARMNQTQHGESDLAEVQYASRFWANPLSITEAPASGSLHFSFSPLTCVLDISLRNIKPGDKVKKISLKGGKSDQLVEYPYPERTYPFMSKWQLNQSSIEGELTFGIVANTISYQPNVSVTMNPAMATDFTASIVIFPRDLPVLVAMGENGAQDAPRDLQIVVSVENADRTETYTVNARSNSNLNGDPEDVGVWMNTFVPGGRYNAGEVDFTDLAYDKPTGYIPASPPDGTPDPDRAEAGKENGIRYPYGTGTNQWLLFYPVVDAPDPVPVYVWSHTNSSSGSNPTQTARSFGGGTIANCNTAGIAVISWESVVQVNTSTDVTTCENDLERVYAWMALYASDLNIDINNIFIGGASRGTIVSWKMICSGDGRISGAYMVQALPESVWNPTYSNGGTYEKNINGTILSRITVNNPPLFLSYNVGMESNDNHHPIYGYWIQRKYQDLGIGDRCTVRDNYKANYDNLVPFIQAHLR